MYLKKTAAFLYFLLFFFEFFTPVCYATDGLLVSADNKNIEFVNTDKQLSLNMSSESESKKAEKNEIVIKKKTKVPVVVTHEVTSKNAATGRKIEARIFKDIIINDVVIFREGDRAVLNVAYSKKAGFLGIPGKLTIRDGEVFDINGKEYKADLEQLLVGKAKLYPKILATISLFFLWPFLFFALVKGDEAELPSYAPIETFIRNNTIFVPRL